MSRPAHPLTMIGRENHRTLEDGCTACRYSKVYCHAMLSMVDGQPCCDACTH